MTDQRHHHEQHRQRRRPWHNVKTNWKRLVIVALMLIAMAAYILSMDEAWRPFRARPEQPAANSGMNDQ